MGEQERTDEKDQPENQDAKERLGFLHRHFRASLICCQE